LHLHHIANARGVVNPTYTDMPRLIQCAVSRRTALSVPAGCGFGSNKQTTLNIWLFNTHQFAHLGLPKGTLVLHGRTKSTSDVERRQMELARTIPGTTKSEAFTRNASPDHTAVSPACDEAGDAAHDDDPWNHPDSMRRYLDRLVGATPDSPNAITSTQPGGFPSKTGIIVDAAVLSQLGKKGGIFHYIKSTYNKQLHIVKQRGRQPHYLANTGKVRIQRLEWA
jgi:hypothetical protein